LKVYPIIAKKRGKSFMKKIVLLVTASAMCLVFYSCLKKNNNECSFTDLNIQAPEAEVTRVEAYLDSVGITNATKDPAGFYYIIQNTGTGLSPDVCSAVSVNYTGMLANGSIFGATAGTPEMYTLGYLIAGWQKGLPHIKAGGKMKLFLPPSLGYGATAKTSTDDQGNTVVVIPSNSILIFDLELVGVQQ
jgi:FKBP-type peptidyl-prolyl cis-trans isomerase FkpA